MIQNIIQTYAKTKISRQDKFLAAESFLFKV